MAEQYERIIIGAGAAGLFCAAGTDKKVDGLIIDHSHRPGLKLMLSGSGQCNITHAGSIKNFLTCYGQAGKQLRGVLYAANNQMLMEFIEGLGVSLFERPDGKVFPKSLKASEILNALLRKAESNGFNLHLDENVTSIDYENGRYVITTSRGHYETPVLVIAAGGKSYPRTGSDGSLHPVIESLGIKVEALSPALTPVFVHGYSYKNASGISFKDVKVSIEGHTNVDDLLLTHKGFSGPAVINISRYVTAGMKININYWHPHTDLELESLIKKSYQHERKQISTFISRITALPLGFIEVLLNELGIDGSRRASTLSGEDIRSISKGICSHEYDISGIGSFAEAMVTKGGVSLDEISMKTMESKKYPGLYFAGEILDVDGDTGGYNLQFAYSSAMAIVRALRN